MNLSAEYESVTRLQNVPTQCILTVKLHALLRVNTASKFVVSFMLRPLCPVTHSIRSQLEYKDGMDNGK
jgi:hypothetical protein